MSAALVSGINPLDPVVEHNCFAFQSGGIGDTSLTGGLPQAPQLVDARPDTVDTSRLPDPSSASFRQEKIAHYDFDALIKQEHPNNAQDAPTQTEPLGRSAVSNNEHHSSGQKVFQHPNAQFEAPATFYHSFPANPEWTISSTVGNHTSSESPFPLQVKSEPMIHAAVASEYAKVEENTADHRSMPRNHLDPPQWKPEIPGPPDLSIQEQPHLMVYQDYAIDNDDDPFDINDDDFIMEDCTSTGNHQDHFSNDHLKKNDLGVIVALQADQDNRGLRLRTFRSFIDRPDMLATYVPSPQSSPLTDTMSARIFCHFVNVTAPCLSMFERHPANPSLIFQGQPVPPSQQHIWTCK